MNSMLLFGFRDYPKDKYALLTVFRLFCSNKNQCVSDTNVLTY